MPTVALSQPMSRLYPAHITMHDPSYGDGDPASIRGMPTGRTMTMLELGWVFELGGLPAGSTVRIDSQLSTSGSCASREY